MAWLHTMHNIMKEAHHVLYVCIIYYNMKLHAEKRRMGRQSTHIMCVCTRSPPPSSRQGERKRRAKIKIGKDSFPGASFPWCVCVCVPKVDVPLPLSPPLSQGVWVVASAPPPPPFSRSVRARPTRASQPFPRQPGFESFQKLEKIDLNL